MHIKFFFTIFIFIFTLSLHAQLPESTYPESTEDWSTAVIHNGIIIQNNQVIEGTTAYIGFPKTCMHGGAPFILQDHGDLVSFRNI